MSEAPPPRAEALHGALVEGGATHLVGLPDSTSAPLIDLALERGALRYLPVTREGEAFALAAGLWLGGATPVVVIQNTGLLESGDALRGTAQRMGVPLLTLVTWRGFGHRGDVSAGGDVPDLTSADLDSVAVFTKPTLAAWHVPHALYERDDDVGSMKALWSEAARERRPVALLLPRVLARP